MRWVFTHLSVSLSVDDGQFKDNLGPLVQRMQARSAQPARSVAGTLNSAFREMTTFLHMAAGIGTVVELGTNVGAHTQNAIFFCRSSK